MKAGGFQRVWDEARKLKGVLGLDNGPLKLHNRVVLSIAPPWRSSSSLAQNSLDQLAGEDLTHWLSTAYHAARRQPIRDQEA